MSKISPAHFSPLVLQTDFTQEQKNDRKIVLLNNQFVWLTEKEITEQKAVRLSLKTIIAAAKGIHGTGLTETEYSNLSKNLKWMNEKIVRYNKAIQGHFITKMIDAVLSFITGGRLHLTYSRLDENITKILHNLQLLEMDDKTLLEYFANRSFLKENGLEEISSFADTQKMRNDQKDLLVRLFKLGHKKTEQEVELKGCLQKYLYENKILDPSIYDDDVPSPDEKNDEIIPNNQLLKMNSEELLAYFRDKSFFKENGFENITQDNLQGMDNDQIELLEKLYLIKHKETLEELANHACLNDFLAEREKQKIGHNIKLLQMDDKSLLVYYRDKSFLKENGIEDIFGDDEVQQLRKDQTDLLERLFQLNHKKTVEEIANKSCLTRFITKKMKEDPKTEALEKCFKANLFEMIVFAKKMFSSIVSGQEGKESKSRPHVQKWQKENRYYINPKLEFDRAQDEMMINFGKIANGKFKTVKKQMLLQKREMEAIAKQPLNEMSKQELKLTQTAQGLPHVVRLRSVKEHYSIKKKQDVIVMRLQFYNMGTLGAHLTTMNRREKLQIAADILKGVMGLHSRDIIHRDLKLDNIFLEKVSENGKETPRASVGDLGSGCFSENDPMANAFTGTPFYMPPEAFEGSPATFTFDVWSLGILLSQLMKGHTPLDKALGSQNKNQYNPYYSDLIHLIEKLNDPENNPMPKDLDSIDYMIWKMLQINPNERMKLEDALTIIEKHLASA